MVLGFENLIYASFGVCLGLFVGAMPGIGGNAAIGLLIPFTFFLDPVVAIVALLAIGKGSSFGGSIPAVLLNMPGTTQASMTALDGHKLTERKKPKKALHTALVGSVGGDLFSDVALLIAAPPLAAVALSVGPAEYATIILFALMIIGTLVSNSPIKGLISALLGLILSNVGIDIFSALPRLTFGSVMLEDGIPDVSLMLGLMVISEIFLKLEGELKHPIARIKMQALDKSEEGLTLKEAGEVAPTILRSGAIGTLIGAAPGLGSTIGALLSFNATKKLVKRKDKDTELMHGVAAAEAGNSAGTGANMIPLLTLGIPGNAEAALVLGAFMIHGMTPGPFLMQQQGPLVYAIILSLILANILLFTYGFFFIHIARYLLAVPMKCLLPVILVVTTIGTYSMNRSVFDVGVMFFFGVVGLIMRKNGFAIIPMVVAFLLGGMLENGVRRSLALSAGDFSIFLSSPISIAFASMSMMAVAFILYGFWRQFRGGSSPATITSQQED